MSLRYHPITQEILRIISPNNRKIGQPIKIYHQALIHVMDTSKDFYTYKVMSFDINREYEKNISDELSISLAFAPGVWNDYILPYIDNIEITVIRSSYPNAANQEIRRYKAYCKNPRDFRKESPQLQNLSTSTIDRMDIIILDFQLVPLLIEKLLTVQCGTIFVKSTVGDAIKTMLVNESSKIIGLHDQDMLQGVDMVDPDNTTVYQNIPIPHSTKLINLPNYMQKKVFGVYQQGLGHYIQNAMWYIYPQWRVDRSDNLIRFINIFVTEKNFFKYADYTYRTEGNDLYIVGCLDKQSNDLNSAKLLNKGNGLRVVNPNVNSTEESVKVKDNKAIAIRSNNVSEFNIIKSPNDNQHAPIMSNKDIFDGAVETNIYEQISRLEGNIGKIYGIVWQHSNPDLIKPGSIVRMHYVSKNDEQEMIEGIVMKVHHYIQAMNPGLTSISYDCTSGIFIYSKEVKKT